MYVYVQCGKTLVSEGFTFQSVTFLFCRIMTEAPRSRRLLIWLLDSLLTSRLLFRHLRKRGIHVYLWVLNDDDDYRRAFHRLGVDGVMTDYPTKLRRFLDEEGVGAVAGPVGDD